MPKVVEVLTWDVSTTHTANAVCGDRGVVFTVTRSRDGKRFAAAVAEGAVDMDGTFVEDTHVLIGDKYRSAATAQRACASYERMWRQADGRPHAVRDQLAVIEMASHMMRAAGTIAQA